MEDKNDQYKKSPEISKANAGQQTVSTGQQLTNKQAVPSPEEEIKEAYRKASQGEDTF